MPPLRPVVLPRSVWTRVLLPLLGWRAALRSASVCRALCAAVCDDAFWADVEADLLRRNPLLCTTLGGGVGGGARRRCERVLRASAAVRALRDRGGSVPSAKLGRMLTDVRCKGVANPLQHAALGRNGTLYYWDKTAAELRKMSVCDAGAAPDAPATPAASPARRRLTAAPSRYADAASPTLRGVAAAKAAAAAAAAAETPCPRIACFHAPSGVLAVCCQTSPPSIRLVDTTTAPRAAGGASCAAADVLSAPPSGGHGAGVSAMQMDERCVYTASFDKTVKVWARPQPADGGGGGGGGGLQRTYRRHAEAVTHLLVDPFGSGGGQFVSAAAAGGCPEVLIWSVETGTAAKVRLPLVRSVRGLCATALVDLGGGAFDGHSFGLGISNRFVVVDARAGAAVLDVVMTKGHLSCAHAAGHVVYCGGGETAPELAVMDVRAPKVRSLPQTGHERPLTAIRAHRGAGGDDGSDGTVFTASRDGTVRLWDEGALLGAGAAAVPPAATLFGSTRLGGVHALGFDGLRLVAVRSQSVQVVDFSASCGGKRKAGTAKNLMF